MKTYEFTVVLQGNGDTEIEAACNAVDAFCLIPRDIGNGTLVRDKIIVEVRDGVAYCDDDKVEIIDHDQQKRIPED